MKNLKIKYLFVILILAISSLFFQCTSKQILKKYYVLDEKIDSTLIKQAPLPYSVMIEPFWANPAYKTKQIALRTANHELQYYYYHLWSEVPDVALRFLLWRKLKTVNLFQNCELAISQVFPQYGISGTLDRLEVKNRDKKNKYPMARIKGRLELFDFKTRQMVVRHSFDRAMNLPKKFSMNQFVTSVNQMMNEEIDLFIKKMSSSLQ